MKATGIVRRIDDLGRIVIPKEIRRTLHIRESDPLEIFTDREGQVILKKYSPIGEMTTFARQYAESLAQVSGHTALIADRDQFIAAAGGCKQLLNKSVSRQLEEKVNNRETVIATKGDRNYVNIAEDIAVDYAWQLITPILCEGDIIGSVILLENDGRNRVKIPPGYDRLSYRYIISHQLLLIMYEHLCQTHRPVRRSYLSSRVAPRRVYPVRGFCP